MLRSIKSFPHNPGFYRPHDEIFLENEENNGNQHFLLSSQCFSRSLYNIQLFISLILSFVLFVKGNPSIIKSFLASLAVGQ